MISLFKKPKIFFTLIGLGIALTLGIVGLQIHLTSVSAQVIPIIVNKDHLDFGTVFPGEQRSGNFLVSIAQDYTGDPVTYQIIQKRKPLPEGYIGDGEDPDMPGYYRNLCPFLTKTNDEGEGDTENNAVVGGEGDNSDLWVIDFNVPAIMGYVAQNHTYGVVSTESDYGCDISIDLDLAELCDSNEELVINGGFEAPIVVHSAKWYIYDQPQTNWVTNWTTTTPATFGGYSRPSIALLELHRGVAAGWNPAEGSQYAELDADWFGPDNSLNGEPATVIIYQDLATLPGQNYNIKFSFSPRPGTSMAENILEFSWGGDIQPLISAAGGTGTNWTEYTYNFIATSTTTRLQFAERGLSNSLGTFLDKVSVHCLAP